LLRERHDAEILHDAGLLFDRHPHLLETLELPFEVWIINLPAGEHLRPEYLKINPRGTIPTLVLDDGRALTDFNPSRCGSLKPTRAASCCRMIPPWLRAPSSWLDFALIQLHGEGYMRIFTSERYIASSEAQQGCT